MAKLRESQGAAYEIERKGCFKLSQDPTPANACMKKCTILE
jgi:hypothetical protein